MFADTPALDNIKSFARFDLPTNLILPPKGRMSVLGAATDAAASHELRDLSIWTLVYQRPMNTVGLITDIAKNEKNPRLRKSAAWALMKLGAVDSLRQTLASEADANVAAWKQHLLNDLNDTTTSPDSRAVRKRDGAPFDLTMPLEVEGVVEFKDKSGTWHTYATGPLSNERLIGKLTPGVNADNFDTTVVLQKRIRNLNGSGRDYVEGYSLKGLSRMVSDNVIRHQYEASSQHDIFPSGIVGDESMGKIELATATLQRYADTNLSFSPQSPFPYPHSVRGTFRGFVYMNPSVIDSPDKNIDGRLQILSPVDPKAGHLVNGVFYGTFRGVLEDVDGDGIVELNGVEMLVDRHGNVPNRTPLSQQW